MAKRIGGMSATLTLKSQQFSKGLKKARMGIRGFSQRIKRLGRTLTSLPGLAAIGGIGGIVLGLKRAGESIDNIGHVSTRLGIGTKELSRLQFAAKTAGIDSRNLELSLQRMTRRVAEAAKGTGEAKKAIADMGLSAKELVQLSPDKMLERFADKLKEASGPADRLRIAFKLFDSEGAKLVQVLGGGSEGLRKLGDIADKTGFSVSRLDVQKIQRAKFAFDKLSAVISGVARRLVIELAPTIEAIAESLSNLRINLSGVGLNLIEFGRGTAKVFAALLRWVLMTERGFLSFAITSDLVFGTKHKGLATRLKEIAQQLKALGANNIDDFFNRFADAAVNANGAVDRTFQAIKTFASIGSAGVTKSPFAAAVEQGSQAATKATFLFSRDASARDNATLVLGRDIKREIQRLARIAERAAKRNRRTPPVPVP